MAKRIGVFVYGLVSYAIFFGTFLYAIGFIGNWFVPKSMDSPAEVPFAEALVVNATLLGIFAIQHSVMARRGFKAMWTRIVPKEAERSTYVLFSSLALIVLFWQWRPMGGVIWDVQNEAARMVIMGMYLGGVLLVLIATFLINHFDLFGLKQSWMALLGKEYKPERFRTPWLYKHVRHPLYLGWLFTFWAAPTMTVAHLVFAIATTAYIFIAIQFEERDLIHEHGDAYRRYRASTPMILPMGTKSEPRQAAKSAVA